MKKIYLIHGWGGSGSGGWFDWLKKELEGKAEVVSFDMPDTNYPKIDKWVGFLEKNVKNVDEETYFIGHSIGCQAILRFLEGLSPEKKIGGCVFAAGWFNLKESTYEDDEDREIAKPWIEISIDYDEVKKHCDNFLAIFSDNDPYVPTSDAELFQERIHAKILIKHKQGHFNETQEIREILDFIF
jgi:predicted alpha/beta hydrolase family esterase